jgi:hypothetical protein
MRYISYPSWQVLLEEHREESLKKRIERLVEAWKENDADREEILSEIDLLKQNMEVGKKRLKVLDRFKIEAEVRTDHLQQAMQGLQPEDFERGWVRFFQIL